MAARSIARIGGAARSSNGRLAPPPAALSRPSSAGGGGISRSFKFNHRQHQRFEIAKDFAPATTRVGGRSPVSSLLRCLSSHAASSSSSPSSSLPSYVKPIDLQAELAWLERELDVGADADADAATSTSTSARRRRRISSPTRVAGLVVAAANAGRVDVLQRVLALIDQSADANNRGLLLTLLTQLTRFSDVKPIQLLLERLAVIDEQTEAKVIEGQMRARDAADEEKERSCETMDGLLNTINEEIEDEGSTLLDRPYAYYAAYRAILTEYAGRRDVPSIVHALELLSRSATRADTEMRALVRKCMVDVGVKPFLDVLKAKQQAARRNTSATTSQSSGPHPETLNFLVRCMSAMASEGKLTPEVHLDALRLATLTSTVMKQHSGHGTDNFNTYRSLLQFYRLAGSKPAVEGLLVDFDKHKVVVASAMMDSALPGLRLSQLDRVLKALRTKKNPTKPSLGLYGRIAHAINYNESIDDFLNFFVGNFKADFPGQPIDAAIITRALLSFAKSLHVSKATAIFNLMHPVKKRLSSDPSFPHVQLCTADQDCYVIYVNMMAKVSKYLKDEEKVRFLKPPVPTPAEVVSLARQAFDIALDAMIAPPLALYSSMLSIYIDANQIGQADVVFSQMKDLGYDPTPEQYQQLIEGFTALGNTVAATNLQREMRRLSWTPAADQRHHHNPSHSHHHNPNYHHHN